MSFGSIDDSRANERAIAASGARGILWIIWHAVRIPIVDAFDSQMPIAVDWRAERTRWCAKRSANSARWSRRTR